MKRLSYIVASLSLAGCAGTHHTRHHGWTSAQRSGFIRSCEGQRTIVIGVKMTRQQIDRYCVGQLGIAQERNPQHKRNGYF